MKFTIGHKVSILVLAMSALSIFAISSMCLANLITAVDEMTDSVNMLGEEVRDTSNETMIRQMKLRLTGLAAEKARYVESYFAGQRDMVVLIADTMTAIYENENQYKGRIVNEPNENKEGRLTVQLLYSTAIEDRSTEEVIQETLLVGNIQDLLLAVNRNNPMLASDYVATESGITVMADYRSSAKFDGNHQQMPYEAQTRPWYQGALETGRPFFTDVTQDVHGGGAGIMCGVPFYKGDTVMGVAGAGIYLSKIDGIVEETQIGESGFACIINNKGQVNFSSRKSGELAVNTENMEDLRESGNRELAAAAEKMVEGESGICEAEIDGIEAYLAYAPMQEMGWSFVTVIEQDEVRKPSQELMSMIEKETNDNIEDGRIKIMGTMLYLASAAVFLFLLAIVASVMISRKITGPIAELTRAVKKIDGENLEFICDLETTDETKTLELAFKMMTENMKLYIENLTKVTAEKERIGAELNVAAQIQADMLPRIFPAFSDRTDFDVYAVMEPAKEVGGDFYDFFLTDENHLVVVVGDVSGKGVPAALFMVIAKTLLRNRAQNGEPLERIFENTNDQLCEGNEAGLFVTAFMGVLAMDTGEFDYVNAGHNPPLICKRDGTSAWMVCDPGFVLAGMEHIRYRSCRVVLEPGDRIYLYTDGVTEAVNEKNDMYGEDRLEQKLREYAGRSLQRVLSGIRGDISRFAGHTEQFDDITMLALEYRGRLTKPGELTVTAQDIELERVILFVRETMKAHGCPEEIFGPVELSVEEIFVNIAHYAYPEETGADNPVWISAWSGVESNGGENLFRVIFEDEGWEYDPLKKEDPDITKGAEERPFGGLGIFLVKQSMDRLEYCRRGKRNVLTMEKCWRIKEE